MLDLDETLIHTEFEKVMGFDFKLTVNTSGQKTINPSAAHLVNIWVRKRPFVDAFLRRMTRYYEIVVFTASIRSYAEAILKKLDPDGDIVDHLLCRDYCTTSVNEKTGKVSYMKDLSRLGRSLHKTLIIDNSPDCYQLQPENAIPITSWYECRHDYELKKCEVLLKLMSS